MTPKTQSVCKWCEQAIRLTTTVDIPEFVWASPDGAVFCQKFAKPTGHEPVAGPASPECGQFTGRSSDGIESHCKKLRGHGGSCNPLHGIVFEVARPSGPSAPQTSAAPACDFCENKRCSHPLMWHKGKLVHHATGKSGYYPCTAAPQPVSGDAPKVEEIAAKFFDTPEWLAAATQEADAKALADYLRPYSPHASQTEEKLRRADLEIEALNKELDLLATPASTGEANGWVSVEERLPGFGETVLAVADGKTKIAYRREFYKAEDVKDWHWTIDPLSYYGSQRSRVTHWQPLPPAPGSVPQAPDQSAALRSALEALAQDYKEEVRNAETSFAYMNAMEVLGVPQAEREEQK